MEQRHSDKAVVQTLLVWVLVFLIVFFVRSERAWLMAAVVFAAIGVFLMPVARLIHRLWMALADGLSRVIPSLLLGAVFFIVLTPIALLMRVTRGSALVLKRRERSMLQELSKHYPPESFTKPW